MENKITNWSIKQEMENSFLDYALSVIVSRALPDVRDGLKPVHRRIIWSMYKEGNVNSSPYRKSARTVGDVIGHYHPHGDSAIYESMVRMAQDFSLRHVLIQGQGNFGSVDGDGAAAMRYTEARLSKIASELTEDIRKETIDFIENYDGTTIEPSVLPSKIPNILINGTEGIAVGMATSIPTHNLVEVITAVKSIITNSDISVTEICEIIKAPDFPTGAFIMGTKGIKQAYETGKGSVRIRSKAEINKNQTKIIIKEIPYQVNKSKLIEKIAELSNPKLEDPILSKIKLVRDESDRDGIRIVLELKRDSNAELILSHLYKRTNLESNHSINMVVLVDGVPKQLNVKEILSYYLDHQREIIVRRTKFDLKKALEKEHLVSGFIKALDVIDEIVKIIRRSSNKEDSQKNLISRYSFSEIQAKAIVEMRLYRLTGLEEEKLEIEYKELMDLIEKLNYILNNEDEVDRIIVEKLDEIILKYGEDRKSIIQDYNEDGVDEDLIDKNDLVLTLTKNGYIKTTLESDFNIQNRAGKGSKGLKIYDDDEVLMSKEVHSHSHLLYFTTNNKVYRNKAYNIGVTNKTSLGMSVANLFKFEQDEKIIKIIELQDIDSGYIVFVTKKGLIKKTSIKEFNRINKNGKKYSSYTDDSLADVFFAKDDDYVQVVSSENKSVMFSLNTIRSMSRNSKGVKAIKLDNNNIVTSATSIKLDGYIITITNEGYGKLVKITNNSQSSNGKIVNKGFTPKKRGGKGMLISKKSDKSGKVIFNRYLTEEEINNLNIMLITNQGKTLKTSLKEFPVSSRTSQGSIIQKMQNEEKISTSFITKYRNDDEEDSNNENQ